MTSVLEETVAQTNFADSATETTGGPQFYTALQQAAQKAVGSIFTGTVTPIEYPQQGDFQWFFLSPNQVFNAGTYDYITANVSPGSVAGAAALSPAGGFPNAYVQVLSKIQYTLSSSDLNAVNKQQTLANVQIQTLVANFQAAFGPITPEQVTAAKAKLGWAPTLQDYIVSYMMGYVWSGMQANDQPPLPYTTMAAARDLRALLPLAPLSATPSITAAGNYLSLMKPVLIIQANQQQSSWILAQLVGNTQSPSTANGGMSTADPATGKVLPPNVGYGLGSASLASITNDLHNTARTISLDMQTSSAAGNQVNVTVKGQTGFSVGSWLQFSTSAGATYDMSKAAGTSASARVTMKWSGYSMVPISPLAWQQATSIGWYFDNPIATAVATGTQDVTNYKFIAPLPYNLKAFAEGGNFGYLSHLLIANFPTVSITYTNADFSRFQQTWSEHVAGNLSLFGWINLGSFSQGAYGSSYEQGSNNSTFTVTFAASPELVGLPQMQQQAYVIAGAFDNPGVATPSLPEAKK